MRHKFTTLPFAITLAFLLPAAGAQQQAANRISSGSPSAHYQRPQTAVRTPHGMVVTDEQLASEAGVAILKKGGNAVDAAVAVAFALAVVEPEAGNIGGGGFMLVRLADGTAKFVDYREEAPRKSSRDMYQRPDGTTDPAGSIVGYRAVAVPGTVAGLALALQSFGTMPLSEVMAPAIQLAGQGLRVNEKLAAALLDSKSRLSLFPMSRRIFVKNGAGYQTGELFRQPQLAATLSRIAKNGPDEFYGGKTGQKLAAEMARHGGILTQEDLEDYRPKIRDALHAEYRFNGNSWEVITSPPPSSGGIGVIEALNILGPIGLKNWNDAESVHWVTEAMRRVFADRATYLADSDFVPVPVRGLTDPRYAAELRDTIDPENATPSAKVNAGNPLPFDDIRPAHPDASDEHVFLNRSDAAQEMEQEAVRSGHTTHFSVVDTAGNAVANTYTLNDNFGSGVTTSTGFLLNDEMDDFTAHPGSPNMFGLVQSDKNVIGPGKRPLSSMTPTILLRNGKLSFVTGSPGGPRIISATLLSVLNWMRLGMDAQAAIDAPRFHHQWMPDILWVEPSFSTDTANELERRGYKIERRDTIGEVEAIGIDPATGERLGAPDGRREGVAAGY